jgi:hypothetical protein
MKRIAATLLGLTLLAGSTAATLAQTTVLAHKHTEVDAVITTTLDSGKNHDGDTFVLDEHEGFFHHNPLLKGAVIDGHLEDVTAAGPTHKATMNVIFDDIKFPDGSTEPLRVKVKTLSEFEPKTHHIRDVGLIVGGAVAGHIVSKKTGKKGGTLTGAAAGFALATTLKSNIVVKKGTLVRLILIDDVVQPAAATSSM